MKTIRFNTIDNKKKLSPNDMKNLKGGTSYTCACKNGPGLWTCYNPSPGSDCGISEYCDEQGGECH